MKTGAVDYGNDDSNDDDIRLSDRLLLSLALYSKDRRYHVLYFVCPH